MSNNVDLTVSLLFFITKRTMKKITTLFKKDLNNLSRVLPEYDPENMWVLESGIPTRKYDGTACAVIDGKLYKRYDAKHGKKLPEGAIPCQEPDAITGHHPHWIPVTEQDKYHNEAFIKNRFSDRTYELCGPKVQGNPENFTGHILIPHGQDVLPLTDFSFESIKKYLEENNIEGIVFHNEDGRMCKIRKSDFGIKRI